MKEININIEGYNVNGICVGCLNYNRTMYYHKDVKECFQLLGDIDVPDGLNIQVCWECLAMVRATKRFQEQILKSYDILIEYSKKHTFLNSPKDLTRHAVKKLDITKCETINVSNPIDEREIDIPLKEEYNEYLDFEVEPKIEQDMVFDESQFSEDFNNATPDFPTQDVQDNELTSDDDIQLSKLKVKKERKNKKDRSKKDRKRRDKSKQNEKQPNRKLKNLPEDLVELYTMTEKEMWEVREQDIENKDFVKIKYKCCDCVIAFNSEKLMNYHLKGKHSQKSKECHQCDVCKAYFMTKDKFSVHRSLHLAAFKCKECGFRTSLKRLMMKHSRVHRNGSSSEFKCSMCSTTFSTKSKLTYHRGICHQERPQCDCCGKVFANKMTLKYHLKMTPQSKEEKPIEKLNIPCKGCSKIFHSKKSYRAHVVIHSGHTYPCPTCGKLFLWKRNLARHARNHRERDANPSPTPHQCLHHTHQPCSIHRSVIHSGHTYPCPTCGKLFLWKRNLARHARNHRERDANPSPTPHQCLHHTHQPCSIHRSVIHSGHTYPCPTCGKLFLWKRNLARHARNHRERDANPSPTPHQCLHHTHQPCSIHRSVIHSGHTYPCPTCGKLFLWKRNLARHARNHRERDANPSPTPHQCLHHTHQPCSIHRSVIHSGHTYPCPTCGKLFLWKRNLARHARNHHERDANPSPTPHQCLHHTHQPCSIHRSVIHSGHTYPCPTCGKLFLWKRNLARHARNHRERDANPSPTPHQCLHHTHQPCSIHRSVIHSGHTYPCPTCGKLFLWKRNLARHARNHRERDANPSPTPHQCLHHTHQPCSIHRSVIHSGHTYPCPTCGKLFLWKRNLARHARNHRERDANPSPTPHQCLHHTHQPCSIHRSVIHSGHTYPCPTCGKLFLWKRNLARHARNHRERDANPSPTPHQCLHHTHQPCSIHRSVIHSGHTYPCPTCGKLFLWKRNLARHARNHRERDANPSPTPHQCLHHTHQPCSIHRSVIHSGHTYPCPTCGKLFLWKRNLARHARNHRERDANPSPTPHQCLHHTHQPCSIHRSVIHSGHTYPCPTCGKLFLWKRNLARHARNHRERDANPSPTPHQCLHHTHQPCSIHRSVIHSGHTYPCPTCGKLFLWKRNLARHARNHRERDAGALHECRPCAKTFSSRDCYNNHMRLSKRHLAEDAYQHECNYCGKKFPTKWYMIDHIDWEHLKRIKYQCSVCFKAFKTSKIMVAHMNNIHGGKKRELEGEHLCDICGKSYKTVKRLKGHVWAMHTKRSSTKVFKCKLCPATFTWQTSIYKHMKMMHDHTKRSKPPRAPQVKKQESYPGIELANRMQYFQQNITNNIVQNIVQTVHIQPIGVVQNIG